jgi:hypothetical protein
MRLYLGRGALRAGIVAAVIAAASLAATSASANTYTWSVSMSGAQQTASGIPGDPDGTGTANVSANTATNSVCATVTWANIANPVVAGHIHEGMQGQPENPAVTINLFGPNINGAGSGVSGCGVAPGAVIDKMAQYPELFNVVVHNQQFPAGAIRGQLVRGNINDVLCDVPILCPGP